ncbi:cyclic pyranopterin monophosphate synthase MoaC [Alkalicoccus urumqiensis]|uniref:Cyclic pyranopterin monophosphate synthase n=1 Tax=Alkalicoccus urumqiensis TaxID=1548213 RepID=A0A2P6MJ96_ALKUR|nr:cyclic pyranopterin monophosphate synthase MoaC [Alkalicoccus urumqiensis]PRO66364.1 cyclic pyranopterin monophosphate synthase MoaC [Alkalicoccus urumqiensis]
MKDLTHVNEQGRARMVDVGEKEVTSRTAEAVSSVEVNQEIYEQIQHNTIKKGDVLSVAQVAGIMAAKQTSSIIPMCHPLPLTGVDVSFDWNVKEQTYILQITSRVKTTGKTGVEMEALTCASAAALTVYDMCKAIDKGMVIGPTYLKEKTGGKSGDFRREERGS